jgi:4-amino-4-deoxy-L-arabinose transferase-like glycosyltransferase
LNNCNHKPNLNAEEDQYNYFMQKFRLALIALFILWISLVIGAFYVAQKPLAMQVASGLFSVLWTLTLTGLIVMDASTLGGFLIKKFFPTFDSGERLLLGTGLGLGIFGLLGFGLAVTGLAKPIILLLILIGIWLPSIWLGALHQVQDDVRSVGQILQSSTERSVKWIPWLTVIALILSFIVAFAPPVDSFDALAYHLTVPALWLKEGGLAANQVLPSYWFPELAEGVFVWGLGLGNEIMPQLIHLCWFILTIALLWLWTQKVWKNELAWRAVALCISIPSLPMVAAWAYTDFTLCFFIVAVLYLLWRADTFPDRRILILAGCLSGMAMGVKYASFILPLFAVIWLLWRHGRPTRELMHSMILFIGPALLVGCLWYIRNWIWTGNPVFPFIFGGKFWDAFRAARYTIPRSGVGWNPLDLILLPFNVTLGHRDTTYYDGRIGPLWLTLLPVCILVLFLLRKESAKKRGMMFLLATYSAVSFGLWTFGVINTRGLWQSRYLFPALIVISPLAGFAWEKITGINLKHFRVSYVFDVLVFLCISVSLLDFGLFVLARNPIATALGIESKQAYYEKYQPTYADALALVNQTPENASVYFLYEPRSYGMNRTVQSDLVLDNLDHDFYLNHTPENVLQAWQAEGYTYVLYQKAGDSMLAFSEESQQLFSMLTIVAETENTILYQVPTTK